MDKLIELLNEYEQLNMCRKFKEYDIENQNMFENDFVFIKVSELISKRYWFIEWLVEYEKIDLNKIEVFSIFKENRYYNAYQSILMALSIQDNPIEFLVSILK